MTTIVTSPSVSPTNPAVLSTATAYRVTPSEGPTFGEVMRTSTQQLLRGATSAVTALPGGNLIAASFRPLGPSVGVPAGGAIAAAVSQSYLQQSAEGGASIAAAGLDGSSSVEGALNRSHDMNMYMIELQERVSAQNRAFTTYSNVLKAKHDTVKNAINNIR